MAERGPPSLQCILEDTQKYMGWIPEEVQSLGKVEIEREILELKYSLQEEERKHSELQNEIEELDMKSSSSRDAHKMYGDIRPGDTTHQEVMVAYKNFYSNAPRNLLKVLPEEADKFKVWEVISDIVQESFKENKENIIQKIKDKLHKVLLEDNTKTLNEETTDLIRAFSMFIYSESVRIESVKQFLMTEERCDHHAIERTTKIINKKLNPKQFSRSFEEDCILESRITVHGSSEHQGPFDSQYRQRDGKEKRKPFWRSKSNSEIETHVSAGRNNTKYQRNKKIPEPKIETEKVYHKLKEKMTKAIEILELLEEMEALKRKSKRIEEEIKTLKKRVDDAASSMPIYTLESSKHKDASDLEYKMILKLIEAFIHDLENILICTTEEYIDGGSDTREKYKIYGLVLSACGLKKSKPPESLQQKVLSTVKEKHQIDDKIYERYVQEAVVITRDMLTLLPPLIISVHPKRYNEKIHDIKRPAWDESGEEDETRELTYYRPILVFGNELHVAVKGTVGNKKHT
ncbi:PREDICTED: uncharacterized protein LOC109581387 isoform X2 [Amphimedon queenslandica]|uniref:Mitochondria-eating protein C-terminal domain-containing protein n=1 Tax=Amphimedon queenslandica TaxID=400682 RepID=A0A1X7V3K7_AMPQE|nr:PREDICTED: uncharacterized protein LOC109581387 isoform X2 [Amphimedon queenslandica]XP_019851010.1 PREDICTED: uncharacterized protein LOC109581387 isoform X2 [Amphimedon queenslandica]|eukprot:XP_019851009.1 PREDICTED: uncharacterized protein LOC109581387 isoform X2 [Amphimedon queenslandica]